MRTVAGRPVHLHVIFFLRPVRSNKERTPNNCMHCTDCKLVCKLIANSCKFGKISSCDITTTMIVFPEPDPALLSMPLQGHPAALRVVASDLKRIFVLYHENDLVLWFQCCRKDGWRVQCTRHLPCLWSQVVGFALLLATRIGFLITNVKRDSK